MGDIIDMYEMIKDLTQRIDELEETVYEKENNEEETQKEEEEENNQKEQTKSIL